MSKRKRKPKGMVMNLEAFQAANGGPSNSFEVLPSAPLGEAGRRGRGRGGYSRGGGRRDYDYNRGGGGRRGFNNDAEGRGDSSASWRASGERRMPDRGNRGFNRDRGGQDRDRGFSRDMMDGGSRDRENRDTDRNAGNDLDRNTFGTKKQAVFSDRRGRDGGGFNRVNNENSSFDRSNFGTASTGPSRVGGGRREISREKEKPFMEDSRDWRRKEPLRPIRNTRRFDDRAGQDLERDRDRDRSERDDLRSWRREEPLSRSNDRGFGSSFRRNIESQDWRREQRDSPEPPPLKPVAITVASKQHTWNRKPTANSYTSRRFRDREIRESKPFRRFGPSSNALRMGAFSTESTPKGKFVGTSSGFGADILAQTSPQLVASAEFHTAGTSYGRPRLSYTPMITLDPPMASSRIAIPETPIRKRHQAAPEYPALKPKKNIARTPAQNATERRLAKEALEQKKREKAEEKIRKKEERERKLKLKAERIRTVKEHLNKNHSEFLGPLDIDVLRTGTLTLEFEGNQRERKRQIKNLAILLVNSILSPNHDPAFGNALRFIETRKIDDEDRFSLLILTLQQLKEKAGEYKALETIGKLLKRVLQALECDQEDPRDALEDINLRYLAPRVDVESALNEAMSKGLGADVLVKTLHRGEEDGEGSVDPALAEKVLLHLLERLFSSTRQEIDGFFDEAMCSAINDLKNYVSPVNMISMVVLVWFENGEKMEVKDVLLTTVQREILSKQAMLDFQDDVPSKRYQLSKRASLLHLSGWFSELDEELNPPEEYSDDEEEYSESGEEEDSDEE